MNEVLYKSETKKSLKTGDIHSFILKNFLFAKESSLSEKQFRLWQILICLFLQISNQLTTQMDEKFKKQFPTRKELEIVSSTREWKRLDNAARIIQRFFKIYVA